MSATNTLDGMTTQQLQELVERAQATIKAQEAAKAAQGLKWSETYGEVTQDDQYVAVRTSSHWFYVKRSDKTVYYDNKFFPPRGAVGSSMTGGTPLSARWFTDRFRDSISTDENRAAVMKLLVAAGVWRNFDK